MIKPKRAFKLGKLMDHDIVFLHAPDELVQAALDLPYVLRADFWQTDWCLQLSPLYDPAEMRADLEKQLTMFADAAATLGDEPEADE